MSDRPDRYDRHRAIEGFSQEALQRSRIAVIGAGAIGNEVVKNLCLLGVGRIDVCDFDDVALHNLTRSILLRETDVGRPKAAAVAARAARIDPNVTVTALPGDIRDTLGPARVAACDAVIGAVDNFEARLWLNRLCWLTGTTWINAAIDARYASVESFARGAGQPAACYECGLPESVYAKLAERFSCGGLARVAREQRVVPTTAITAGVAGAIAVARALRPPTSARRWLLDTQGGLASEATIARREDCPCCSETPAGAIRAMPGASARDLAAAIVAGTLPDADIELAEPVIVAAQCRHCGPTDARRRLVGLAARRVDATATFCFGCGSEAVAIELRDRFARAGALADALPVDQPLPVAFLRIGDRLVDLTGTG